MSRALVTIRNAADRTLVASWAEQSPIGTRVEFKASKRTLPQNARMWAMLTEVSRQATHCERKFTPDQWKVLFMQAWGREVAFLPALDGQTMIPDYRSSDLSKQEMTELIEFMFAWGAENGIRFTEFTEQAA